MRTLNQFISWVCLSFGIFLVFCESKFINFFFFFAKIYPNCSKREHSFRVFFLSNKYETELLVQEGIFSVGNANLLIFKLYYGKLKHTKIETNTNPHYNPNQQLSKFCF